MLGVDYVYLNYKWHYEFNKLKRIKNMEETTEVEVQESQMGPYRYMGELGDDAIGYCFPVSPDDLDKTLRCIHSVSGGAVEGGRQARNLDMESVYDISLGNNEKLKVVVPMDEGYDAIERCIKALDDAEIKYVLAGLHFSGNEATDFGLNSVSSGTWHISGEKQREACITREEIIDQAVEDGLVSRAALEASPKPCVYEIG